MTNQLSVAERLDGIFKRLKERGEVMIAYDLRLIAQDARTLEAVRRDEDRQKYSQGYMAACGRAERAEARITELEDEIRQLHRTDETYQEDYAALVAENAVMRDALKKLALASSGLTLLTAKRRAWKVLSTLTGGEGNG